MSTQQLIDQARHRATILRLMDHGDTANLIDQLAAELERLERKPLTREQQAQIAEDWAADRLPDIASVICAVERAHHIGEGEGK